MSKKLVILITVFIDILGLGIIIPVMPFYVKSFGASDFTVTMLFAVYALFSFFSAPLLGALSDRIGRRPILLISIFSTAIGWLVFAGAKNLFMLFLGRIIDGAAAGNLPTAQNYLIDISENPKERTTNLGLIGVMFGIGFTVGPMIGGVLGNISHNLPFWMVGAMALINFILAYFYLPEVHHKRSELIEMSYNPFGPILRSFKKKHLMPNFTAWLMFSTAIAIHQSIFALYLGRVFGYGEFAVGIFFTLSGVGIIINQILLRKFWLVRFKEESLQKNMFLAMSFGFVLLAYKNLPILAVGLLLLTVAQSLLRPVTTSMVAGLAGRESGEALGMMSSIMNISSVIGPLIAGAVFGVRAYLPLFISALIAYIGYLVVYSSHNKAEQKKLREEGEAIC